MHFFRYTLLSLLTLCSLSMSAQQAEAVLLNGTLNNCEKDTLFFFVLDGISLRPQGAIPLTSSGDQSVFSLKLPGIPKGIYMVGAGPQKQTRPVLLGDEPVVQLIGQCNTLFRSQALSDDNQAYESAMRQVQNFNKRFQGLITQLGRAQRAGQGADVIHQQMAQLDQERLGLLDSMRKVDDFIAQSVALQTYLSYPNNGEGYPNEITYYANQYFRFVDWKSPHLDRTPLLHEQVKTYARTLGQIGMPNEQQLAYAQGVLSQMPEGSMRYKASLLGLAMGFQQTNPDAFAFFAETYLKQYPKDNPSLTQSFQTTLTQVRAQLIGSVAPEISLPTTEGDTLNLSDLRGKVVLVDFWASWCGPCRRENPRVKALYEKYKDQGFEIYGVSLDRSKDAWVKAIAQDGLPWKHVSDLKYWQSVAARTYGVSSIPYTVLLDREGKIVAKKLRGAALEKKVADVLAAEGK